MCCLFVCFFFSLALCALFFLLCLSLQFSSLLLAYRMHRGISTTTVDALFGVVNIPNVVWIDEQGRIVHTRGVTRSPGLYALGLTWQHTRGSALLGWVGNDAAFLAGQIARQ